MSRWVVCAKKADFNKIAEKYGIDPVTARLLRNRDICTVEEIGEYLYGTLDDLPSPFLLKDVEKAARILTEKIREGKRIRVLGDYDIDGVSATFILRKALLAAGAHVDYYIPDRIADGYGINSRLIDKAAEDRVDVIVTCDNGISAFHEIERAKEAGMTVIVTDHHEVPYEVIDGERFYRIPPADAVINPKQEDCPYPSKNICGAVVAFKLVQVLYEKMGLNMELLYPFVEIEAIATIGDVMELRGENRIIVREGLKRLRHTENKGLRALIKACSLENSQITAYHVGFVLGPCINASGRLDTAARSLALLETESVSEAERLAGELYDLNTTRKAMTEQGTKEAEEQIALKNLQNDKVFVIFLPECHESLAGIIAGRIREKYYRPVFVLTKGGTSVKGSGRSIEGYSMYDALTKCKDLLLKFGGHAMAAGLSLEESRIESFRLRLNETCSLTQEQMSEKIVIDAAVPFSYLRKELVGEIRMLEPFGKGNRKPVFARKNLLVKWPKIVGKNRNVVKLTLVEEDGFTMDAVYFGDAEGFMAEASRDRKMAVTYYPEINSFRGSESLQVIVTDFQPQ